MITILTEEYPQEEDVAWILTHLRGSIVDTVRYEHCLDDEGLWSFKLGLKCIPDVFIEFIAPGGSMCDYIVLENGAPILLVEATQTTESESRNSCLGQRVTKFVVARKYYPNVPFVFLYSQRPSYNTDTAMLHAKIYKTHGIPVYYRDEPFDDMLQDIEAFDNVNELIYKVNYMRKKKGNVPIQIFQTGEFTFFINARLSKGSGRHISHDPNIGIVSILAATIKSFVSNCRITVTSHGVDRLCRPDHKFMIANRDVNLTLEGFEYMTTLCTPLKGSYYRKLHGTTSEKLATILLHELAYTTNGSSILFHNHAGGARSKFKTPEHNISVPKKMSIPDLVIKMNHKIYIIEGKYGYAGYDAAVKQLGGLEDFENLIKEHYPESIIEKGVCLSVPELEKIKRTPILFFAIDKKGAILWNF